MNVVPTVATDVTSPRDTVEELPANLTAMGPSEVHLDAAREAVSPAPRKHLHVEDSPSTVDSRALSPKTSRGKAARDEDEDDEEDDEEEEDSDFEIAAPKTRGNRRNTRSAAAAAKKAKEAKAGGRRRPPRGRRRPVSPSPPRRTRSPIPPSPRAAPPVPPPNTPRDERSSRRRMVRKRTSCPSPRSRCRPRARRT